MFMKIHILESPRFYRFHLNGNVEQLIVFKECFLKRALFRLEKYPEYSRNFLCCQRYQLEDTKRNALDNSDF